MRVLFACLALLGGLLPLIGAAAGPEDLSRFLPEAFAGWKPSAEDRAFTRDTLFDYLDASGEICLAFGFRRLLVRRYSGPALPPLVAEVYDMTVPGDAYGLWSNDQDGEDAPVGRDGIYRGGRLRFWKGPYLVRLLADQEAGGTRERVLDLGRAVAAAIPDDSPRPALMEALPVDRLDRRSLRYFHKQVSLNAHYYLADENVLLLDEGTEVALARYREGWERALLLVCRYRSAADAGRAYLKFARDYFSAKPGPGGEALIERIENGEVAGARQREAFLFLVFQSSDQAACAALLRAAEARAREAFPR